MKQILSLFLVLAGCAATGGSSGSHPGNVTTTFQQPTNLQISAISGAGTPSQLLIGNFNGDAYPDIVLLTDSGAYLFVNQTGSAWSSGVQIAETATAPYTVGAASDLNLDTKGNLDLLLFNRSSAIETFQNDGNASSPSLTRSSQLSRTDIASSIAYAPAKSTSSKQGLILVAASSGNHFWVQQQNLALQSGSIQNLSLASTNPEAGSKALVGDIDGDGYKDFVLVPSTSGQLIQLLANSADASISASSTISRSASTSIRDSLLVDLNSDSKLDLLLATSSGFEFYTGNAAFSGFSLNSTISFPSSTVAATSVVAADFTDDGKLDLFLSRSGNTSLFYTQTADSVFSDITSNAFGSMLSSGTSKVYSADIDQDGYPDIIELKSNGSIAVFINNLTE